MPVWLIRHSLCLSAILHAGWVGRAVFPGWQTPVEDPAAEPAQTGRHPRQQRPSTVCGTRRSSLARRTNQHTPIHTHKHTKCRVVYVRGRDPDRDAKAARGYLSGENYMAASRAAKGHARGRVEGHTAIVGKAPSSWWSPRSGAIEKKVGGMTQKPPRSTAKPSCTTLPGGILSESRIVSPFRFFALDNTVCSPAPARVCSQDVIRTTPLLEALRARMPQPLDWANMWTSGPGTFFSFLPLSPPRSPFPSHSARVVVTGPSYFLSSGHLPDPTPSPPLSPPLPLPLWHRCHRSLCFLLPSGSPLVSFPLSSLFPASLSLRPSVLAQPVCHAAPSFVFVFRV